ncbi:WD40 repeat protein [Massospora cicadina]|nr:WD40 repeat protein [Massospora cicadina]
MVWLDGTATVYNGYSDLRLLETLPRTSTFASPPTQTQGFDNLPEAMVLETLKNPKPINLGRASSIHSEGSIPYAISSSDAEDKVTRQSRASVDGVKFIVEQLEPISIAEAQPSNQAGRYSLESLGKVRSSQKWLERPNLLAVLGTFHIKSPPQLASSPRLTQQPMAQPFTFIHKQLPSDRGIIGLVGSPNKELLGTVTVSSVELWSFNVVGFMVATLDWLTSVALIRPMLFLCQLTRSTDSVVAHGPNVDLVWRWDSRNFCVFVSARQKFRGGRKVARLEGEVIDVCLDRVSYPSLYKLRLCSVTAYAGRLESRECYRILFGLHLISGATRGALPSNLAATSEIIRGVVDGGGYLHFYSISVKEGAGLNPTAPPDWPEAGEYHLVSGLSDGMYPSARTDPARAGSVTPAAVEPRIRCFISLDDEVIVATQRNASIVNYSWKDQVLLGSLNLAQEAATFLKPAEVMVNQMVHDPIQGAFGWLTTDGAVYLVRRKVSSAVTGSLGGAAYPFGNGTPYEWQGTRCHTCDGTSETYATMLAINPQHGLLAVVMRNNTITIYSYHGKAPSKGPTLNVGSQVTCLAWSADGLSLAVGTVTKGLMVFGVYGTTAGVTTSGCFGFDAADLDDEAYSQRVDCLLWCFEGLELLVASNLSDSQKGKFYSLPLSRLASSAQLTSDNAGAPTLLATSKIVMNFFVQTRHGSINPNALAHCAQVPPVYELDNAPIKFISRSGDGQFLAVAGRRGLAHYSLLSQKWKLFNNRNQVVLTKLAYFLKEQSLRCVGGMVWYKNTLVVGCKLNGAYQIKFFPREKNLDFLYTLLTLELPTRPVYLNRIDRWLLVYSVDNLLTFYELASDPNGRVAGVNPVQKISLEGVVKAPLTVRAIAWPTQDLHTSFPTMMVLMGGALLLLSPDGPPRYRITQVADGVSHFQLLDVSLAGLHFSLWAYCHGEVRVWYRLSPAADWLVQGLDVPFHPLSLDLTQGLIFGVEQATSDATLAPGIHFLPSFKSHLVFHQILSHLVMLAQDQAVHRFGLHYEPYPYFRYGLEILLHNTLVHAPEHLPKATQLIRQFPHFPEAVVSCARKIEVALWGKLFGAAGPPLHLFERCLAANCLEAASSCLIVLHTLEPSEVSALASAQLLHRAVEGRNMALFHSVARFITRIKGTTDLESLSYYLKCQVIGEGAELSLDSIRAIPRP